MTRLTRRRLLAAAGTATVAGCLGGDGGGGDGDGSPDETDAEGVTLSEVDLINSDDDAHTVHLQVERNGSVVNWSVHDLAAQDGEGTSTAAVAASWPDDPGTYTFEVRVDGETAATTFETSEWACLGVLVKIEDGEPGFYGGPGSSCSGTTTGNATTTT
jgi:hypothetical protein